MKKVWMVLAGLFISCSAFAEQHAEYRIPGYVYGAYYDNDYARMSEVPRDAPTLIFPGATLEEMNEGIPFSGWFRNLSCNAGLVYSYHRHSYTNANNELEFVVATVQKYDDKYVKAVCIKLTRGEGGVYGQWIGSPYRTVGSSELAKTDFVTIAANGAITLGYNAGGFAYRCYAFNMLKFLPKTTPVLTFTNNVGEATLTVDDLKNYAFSSFVAGGSIAPNRFQQNVAAQNKYVTYDANTGKATKIRLEMQVMDDKFLKCPVVELTDGPGGVYACVTKACYVTVAATGASIGYKFLNNDGSYTANVNNSDIAITPLIGGYGVAGLRATKVNAVSYTVDATKTWSELTGSSEPVDDGDLVVTLNVTGVNPTLTFDVPLKVKNIVVESSANQSLTFAGTAPTCEQWDCRGTAGTITFNDFTPVTSAETENILPNAASMMVFNGSTHGFLPFNNAAVTLPCAGVTLGGKQLLAAATLNRYVVKPMTVTGELGLAGALNAGSACTVNWRDGASLAVTNGAALNGNVKLTPATANANVSLVALGTAPVPFTVTRANLVGTGRFEVTAGTLAVSSSSETESLLAVAADGTVNVTVTDSQIRCGYTTTMTLADGAVVHFVNGAGEEVGVGRPQMGVLPGTDALWTPGKGGDTSFSVNGNWSTGTTPAENADVAVSDGGAAATATLDAVQGYGVVSIADGSDITFAATTGSLSGNTLRVGAGAAVTLPVAAATFSSVVIEKGGVLRLAGDGNFGAVISSVTGEGSVQIVSGTVTLTAQSTYTCGTVIKAGACGKLGAFYQAFGMSTAANAITIEAGGALDINGFYDSNYYLKPAGQGLDLGNGRYSGAVFNSGDERNTDKSQFYDVTLGANASIRADANKGWGFVARGHNDAQTWNIGTNTFTKIGDGMLYLKNKGLTIAGTGTFAVEEGSVKYFYNYKDKAACSFAGANATLAIGTNGTFAVSGGFQMKNVRNEGTWELRPTDGVDMDVNTVYTGRGTVIVEGGDKSASLPIVSAQPSTYIVKSGRLAARANSNNGAQNLRNLPGQANVMPKIVVQNGGQYDLNGKFDITSQVVISGKRDANNAESGGAWVNRSGTDLTIDQAQTVQLTLAADAMLSGNSNFGLLGPGHCTTWLELGAYELDIFMQTNKVFFIDNTTVVGTGTLKVRQGTFRFCKYASSGADWTLNVEANGKTMHDVDGTCSNLVYRGQSSGSAKLTAYGTYLPGSATLPKVTLAGVGAGIDVSGKSEAWDIATGGGLTFAAGTKIAVRTGERALQAGERLIAWSELPAGVTEWTLDCAPSQKLYGSAKADGYYVFAKGLSIYVR